MKPVITNYNAFDYRFPRSYREATGQDYHPTIVSPKEKRASVIHAVLYTTTIVFALTTWLTYSFN